jgi:hypothetical protein
MAARRLGLFLAAWLLATTAAAAEDNYPGYEWMANSYVDLASVVFGAPESEEDMLFWVTCNSAEKTVTITVYVDIPGTEVGQKLPIEFAAKNGGLSIPGVISTDEMSGFHFAKAEGFKVKPVIALFEEAGPVTVKTGEVATILPDKGRAAEFTKFAKTRTLD